MESKGEKIGGIAKYWKREHLVLGVGGFPRREMEFRVLKKKDRHKKEKADRIVSFCVIRFDNRRYKNFILYFIWCGYFKNKIM